MSQHPDLTDSRCKKFASVFYFPWRKNPPNPSRLQNLKTEINSLNEYLIDLITFFYFLFQTWENLLKSFMKTSFLSWRSQQTSKFLHFIELCLLLSILHAIPQV